MTTHANFYAAYGVKSVVGCDARVTEAHAFSRAAQALHDIIDDRSRLRAIVLNRRLWKIVQADITDGANTVPPQIKAKVLSLSFFMEKHLKALTNDPETPTAAMIDINRAMSQAQFQTPQTSA